MPQKGSSVEQTVRDIISFLRANTLVSVVGGNLRGTGNGKTLTIRTGPGSSPSVAEGCIFGEIIDTPGSDPVTKSIRGGIIHCGDQNWNIDPQLLSLASDGVWLVSISVTCEVNRDDDNQLLLPGVKTGTEPTGDWTNTVWTTGTDYPDNTNPVVVTGNGVIKLPIGKLTIADGVATISPAGCGNFTITHCAGSLGYTRS